MTRIRRALDSFMSDTIVLLHGSATGSSSWDRVAGLLVSLGASVFAPDMLCYGRSAAPTSSYGIEEEVAHLARVLDLQGIGTLHLVTHSLGSLIGLHLRRALGRRVTRMTLADPVVMSVLHERGEDAAYAEMEEQYQRFMSLSADPEAAAHFSWITGAASAHGIRWDRFRVLGGNGLEHRTISGQCVRRQPPLNQRKGRSW